jgi:hypothetical protein
MYLFKTSGQTFDSVINNQKHAFASKPRVWHSGELVLVSKNKSACHYNEKQVQYIMKLSDIRLLDKGEAEQYWAGTEGRWKYLICCEGTKKIKYPFNLVDVIGPDSKPYNTIQTFKKFDPEDADKVQKYLNKVGLY